MLLTVDVGNTHTVLGLFPNTEQGATKHDAEPARLWRVRTSTRQTTDEAAVVLRGLLDMEGMMPTDVDGIALATVVPSLNRVWQRVAHEHCDCHVLSVGPDTVTGLLDVSAYESTPGADRLADSVAARELYGSPVTVVDLGTATNVEVIDRQGRFAGGVIAPGVQTSLEALVGRAALLHEVELADPGCAIGTTTKQAIQIGVVHSQVDAIDGMVRRIWAQLGYETPVVATGGFSQLIASLSGTITHTDPALTLKGLNIIWQAQ